MSNHEGTLPFRQVRSAPSSLGALTYQPEAQAPTPKGRQKKTCISDPSTPISVFSAQEEVEEDNSNPSSPLSAFSAQEEAEEDSSDPSSPLSVFSAQEEVEEDNSNPSSPLSTFSAQEEVEDDNSNTSSPLSVFSAQEEAEEDNSNTSSPLSVFSAQEEVEEDNTDPSSPLSVTLPPEVQPPPQPDIISEDEIGPATPSPQQVPRTPSIPSPQPPPQPDIISEDEIGPATPSPQQVPITPSIPSPQPIPSTLGIPEYSRSLDLFTIFAALVIGYATSVIGGIIAMNLFLNDLSHTIYYKAMKAYENDFCVYRNGLLLLLGASIGLSSLISLFIALIAYVKWGRRRPILLISIIMGGMGLCLIFWNPNAGTIATGMVFTGAGVGGLLMVVQMVIAEAQSITAFSAPLLLAAIWGVCIVIAGGLIRLRGARRTLLIIASATTLTSLTLLWIVFHFNVNVNFHLKKSDSIYAIALTVLYTVGHACLYGPHGWITEPYPLEAKDVGSILGPALSSLMAVVMQMSSLYLTCALGEYVFLFMAGISLIAGCFIGAFVPETTGISNDEIIENIWRRHCLLSKFEKPCSWDGKGVLDKIKSFKGRNSKFSFLGFLREQLCNLHLLPLPPLKNSTLLDAGKPKIDRDASWGDPIPKVLIEKSDEYIPEDFEEGDPIPKLLIKKADEYIPEDFEEFIYMFSSSTLSSSTASSYSASKGDDDNFIKSISRTFKIFNSFVCKIFNSFVVLCFTKFAYKFPTRAGMAINSAKSGIMFSSYVDGESWAEICSRLGLSQLDMYSHLQDEPPAPYRLHSVGNQTAAHYFVVNFDGAFCLSSKVHGQAKRVFSSSALMAEALAIRSVPVDSDCKEVVILCSNKKDPRSLGKLLL
ncbi:hypothetical protein LguiA_005126 [Lonicera macranthoides]